MGIVKDLLHAVIGAVSGEEADAAGQAHASHQHGHRRHRRASSSGSSKKSSKTGSRTPSPRKHTHGARGPAAAQAARSPAKPTSPPAGRAVAAAAAAPEHVAEFQASRSVTEADERLILAHTREVADYYMIFKPDKDAAAGSGARSVKMCANQAPLLEGGAVDATGELAPVMSALEAHIGALQHAIMVDYAQATAQKGAAIALHAVPGAGIGVSVGANVAAGVGGSAAAKTTLAIALKKARANVSSELLKYNASSLQRAQAAGRRSFVRLAWVCQPVALSDEQHEAMTTQLHLDKQNYIAMARSATHPAEAAIGRVSALQLTDMSDYNCYVVGTEQISDSALATGTKPKAAMNLSSVVGGAATVVGTVLDEDKRKDARKQYGVVSNLKFRDESAAGQWKRAKEAKFKGVPATGKYCVRQFVLVMEEIVDEYEKTLREQTEHLDELKKIDAQTRPKPATVLSPKKGQGEAEADGAEKTLPASQERKEAAEPFLPPVQRVLMQFPCTSTDWSPKDDVTALFKCSRSA